MCDTWLDSSWRAEQMLKNNPYPKINFYPPKWGKTEKMGGFGVFSGLLMRGLK